MENHRCWWQQHNVGNYTISVFSVSRTVDLNRFKDALMQHATSISLFDPTKDDANPVGGSQSPRSRTTQHWIRHQSPREHHILGDPGHSPIWCGIAAALDTQLNHHVVLAAHYRIPPSRSKEVLTEAWKAYNTAKADCVDQNSHRESAEDGDMGRCQIPLRPIAARSPMATCDFTVPIMSANKETLRRTLPLIWENALRSIIDTADIEIEVLQRFNSSNGHDGSNLKGQLSMYEQQFVDPSSKEIPGAANGTTPPGVDANKNKSDTFTALIVDDMQQTVNSETRLPGLDLVQVLAYYPYQAVFEYSVAEDNIACCLRYESSCLRPQQVPKLIAEMSRSISLKLNQGCTKESSNGPDESIKSSLEDIMPHPQNQPSDSNLARDGHEEHEKNPAKASTRKEHVQELKQEDIEAILQLNQRKVKNLATTIPDLLHDITTTSPNKLAISSWDMNLSYAELDDLSGRLAAHIRNELGCQDSPIITCFSKSAVGNVVLLAVMRSGNHYVPLDPPHPQMRKDLVVKDVQPALVLTTSDFEHSFTTDPTQNVAVLDEKLLRGLRKELNCDTTLCQPDDICTILYTSGSTGKPKGAVIRQKAVCTSIKDHGEVIGVDQDTRMLSFASYAFDAHIWDTWTCLVQGGTTCIPEEDERTSDLSNFISQSGITDGLLPPAACSFVEPSSVSGMKRLCIGGEAPSAHEIRRWQKGSKIQLVQVYGPTECCVYSTIKADLQPEEPNNIGRPVGGECWITDPDDVNTLLPPGQPGELVISGGHLADEYLNAPEKTSSIFVEPSWPAWTNVKRAYRTGDLVELGKDGNLHFRGRLDGQIKFHGLRIEVGEVEHHLSQLDLHDDIPVVDLFTSEGEDSRQQLICYFVPKGCARRGPSTVIPKTKELSKLEATLRKKLQERIPSGWMPTQWVFLTGLPLNTSDKVDRKRLREIYQENLEPRRSERKDSLEVADGLDVSKQETLTNVEEDLRSIWANVLHIDEAEIDRDSDLTGLGASSIDVIKIVSQLRNRGYSLTTRVAFEHPCLQDLGEHCRADEDRDVDESTNTAPFSML